MNGRWLTDIGFGARFLPPAYAGGSDKMTEDNRIDWFMFGIAATLAVFGAMMVYSASAMFSLKETESSSQYVYFFKQIGFTIAGLVAMYL